MKVLLAIAMLLFASRMEAVSRCEIGGKAAHWAYDACFGRYETDDELHPGVIACVERNLAFIRAQGSCPAKRMFKAQMCNLLQQTGNRRHSYKSCMADPSVIGSTVRNGGL